MKRCQMCGNKIKPKYDTPKHMGRCTKCYREDRQWGAIFKKKAQ